jgi:hypothetical protein
VIFGALTKSMARSADSFRQAQRAMPDDISEEERLRMREAMMKLNKMNAGIDSLKDQGIK